ncbi:MAG TPA: flippase [Candidatus Acidoferrales bacterium]|nr:flippase [Candidatus Acidoferrales bacterium]
MKRWSSGQILQLARHALVQNTIAMGLVQAGTGFVPLVTVPYLARVLGVAGWGLVAFAQSFGAYMSVFGDYGFALSATREVARHRDDHEKLAEIVAGVLGAKTLLAAGMIAVAFGVQRWVPIFRDNPLLLWAGLFCALARTSSMIWYFQGRERMRLVAWVDIVTQILAAIAIFVLVKKPADGWRALGLQGLGYLFSFFIGLALTYREVSARVPIWRSTWEALRMGWSMFLFRGSVSLYTAGNAFILGLFVSPVWVGYYAGAEKISRAFLNLLNPINQALYPRLSHLVYHARERAVRLARVAIAVMGCGGVALGALVFALAPLLVRVILGKGYEHAVPVLRILALLPPLIALSNVYGIQWMLPLGMDRAFNAIIVIAGVINIGLAIALAPVYLASGMAWSVVSAEIFVTASIYALLRWRKLDPMNYSPQAVGEEV